MTQTMKFLKVIAIATAVIIMIIVVKYRPAYEVSYNGEIIGYIENKENFQTEIDNEILATDDKNVAFIALDNISYKFEFANRNILNEDNVLSVLKNNAKTVYRIYEVAKAASSQDKSQSSDSKNNETDNSQNSEERISSNSVYVNSLEEAEELVTSLKEQYNEIEPELTITTLYLENTISEESIKEAKAKLETEYDSEIKEKKEIDSKTVNGIYLACVPVNGTISSRFGSVESIRDHVHKGLDIAARYGADIKAAATGTITFAGWNNGGYGNLVIINHGNGVETYYGHCSKIFVTVGQEVSAGDLIAEVGSTGNSTGNHLHFEVRINGTQVNPQKYLYN